MSEAALDVADGGPIEGETSQDARSLRVGFGAVPAAGRRTGVPACGPQALGVSRTLEIDTRAGPRFGFQYQDPNLLADGEVVLTFDDGPLRAYTRPILEALAGHCTKATFFVVGRMAVADPEMVQEYARQGHTVGTHTWSHANLQALSPARARAEIELGFSAVQAAMGRPIAPFFRFPYLRDSKGRRTIWPAASSPLFPSTSTARTTAPATPSAVHRKVMADLQRQRKGIILFHDIHDSTARALPGLARRAEGQGLPGGAHLAEREAATVAEFDGQAQQELGRRRATLAASRWPAAP